MSCHKWSSEWENGNHSPVFSVMKDYRVIRRKHTFHDVVSLISCQRLVKTKKSRGRKEEEMEGDEVVNSTAVCLHLSTH